MSSNVFDNSLKTFTSLPENLILEIFFYLSLKDRCSASRVCKQWKRIATDNSLWKHLDLCPYKMDLRRLWKIMRAHFSEALRSLQLSGFLDPATKTQMNKSVLSDAMLIDLKERCPRITELKITKTNLSDVSLTSLPVGLQTLSLTHCYIPNGWFRLLSDNKEILANLRELDLSNSSKTNDADISCLVKARNQLKSLKLDGCYRITGVGLKSIADELHDLESLDVGGTTCEDISVHHLCRGCPKLENLHLTSCVLITDDSLANIATLKLLKTLNLNGCLLISNVGIVNLQACNHLRFVDLKNTAVRENAISSEFKLLLPNCELEID